VNASLLRTPSATYRLQFNSGLRLEDARQLIRYLSALGITDLYASPLFRARENSAHGYDVVDHAMIDPAIGTEEDFKSLANQLRQRGMGLMLDVVPNHMGIDDVNNAWWWDVLENGPSSPYATFFDIDWSPPKESLKDKVLLPFLGDQYGTVLENQQLQLAYDGERFSIAYFKHRFPVGPASWLTVLRFVLEKISPVLSADHAKRMELESIVTALENLPQCTDRDPAQIQQRQREKEVIRRRLAALYSTSLPIHEALDAAIIEFNGRRGDPHSFDRLEQLLAEQAYRLCYWRVASDEINYRRFFDVNSLAAIRVEDPEVFHAVHAAIVSFVKQGWVTALRIDHPDGLLDPQQYLADLQRLCGEAVLAAGDDAARGTSSEIYLAVEKILGHDEELPSDWHVCGTTGYDFLNLLNGLFVARRGAYELRNVYARFTGQAASFAEVFYQSRQAILSFSMSSELYMLSGQLVRISEQHRASRDFTRSAIHRALREVIACFPVYRTYVRPTTRQASPEDRRRILTATRSAKRRNPQMSTAYFDFIGSVLLLEHPDGLCEDDRQQRLQFVLKFQQLTGPVMAKGLEDTAFYRWYPLASLNEVGGDPLAPVTSIEQFHRHNSERLAKWPLSMSATSTHDTKRGEDVRARLNVLSEVPEAWADAIARWQTWNMQRKAEIDGVPAPDANEEYLLYQTLIGTWPREPQPPKERDAYVERIMQYMDKALKEAKLHTSWANPDAEYDRATADFVRAVLDKEKSAEFLRDLDAFVRSIADAGWINSLGQCVAKISAPGCPDFYQGTELWDFHLVDPDNRGRVDFGRRCQMLSDVRERAKCRLPELAAELLAAWPDDRIKLFVTWRALEFRREHAELFQRGNYAPLAVKGMRSEQACAFARECDGQWVITVLPRLIVEACRGTSDVVGKGTPERPEYNAGPQSLFGLDGSFTRWWEGTLLQLPPQAPAEWTHVIAGTKFSIATGEDRGRFLDLSQVFRDFPVAVLHGTQLQVARD